ncbi:putative membrane protein [Halorubrum trapanicum]|uniref:Putative membrane protein n=1 Tax=Halorubrum trapanicum TaxID=29284 RepID=A0A8J7RTG5_9EURY|nr:SHOCT domain-containing protein [Halorubrum trapanicum]MBP1900595.1 putative membrane protein [Halorubrum trapanicum]
MIVLETAAVAPLMGGMAGSGMAGGMGGAMVVFPLVALLTVAALLVVGVVGIRALEDETGGGARPTETDEDPVERLQRRYAAGELTEAEFERALERELEGEGVDETGTGPIAGSDPIGETERAR